MEFIRPELKAQIWRWREVVAASGFVALGLWWAFASFGLVQWIGWVLALAGLALGVVAARRARFNPGSGGVGVVQVDERRVAYFGPLTGGIIDLDDLTALDIDPTGHPVAHWLLSGTGGDVVAIPVDAEGGEALFDVFASLPEIKITDLLAAIEHKPDSKLRLWQRNRPRLH